MVGKVGDACEADGLIVAACEEEEVGGVGGVGGCGGYSVFGRDG